MTVRNYDEMEVDEGGGCPPQDLQNRIISTYLNKSLFEGDVWRIIPHKWLESWKKYSKGLTDICPPLDIRSGSRLRQYGYRRNSLIVFLKGESNETIRLFLVQM